MRRSAVVVLCVLGLVAAAPSVTAAPTRPQADDPPGRAHADRNGNGLSDDLERDVADKRADDRIDVVVTFDGPGDATTAGRAVGRFRLLREFEIIRGFAAQMTVGQARALARVDGVFRVEPDFEVTVDNDASNADFGTAAARRDFGVDGTGARVCVVDTGVDPGHEQLDSKQPVAFYDAINGRAAPYDDHGHGTHVAATAVGDGDGGSPNAATLAGVAPGAGLSAAKVLSSSGSGSESQVVAGVEWCARPHDTDGDGDVDAADEDVDVISMSLGSSASSDGQDAISQAVDAAVTTHGKVVVVAAGNSGDAPYSVGSPGAAAEAITVAAVAEWSSAGGGAANASRGVHLASWSSRGPTADGRTKPDVAAPGVSVTSAQHGTNAGYVTWSGTSMATPFVAGTAALVLEAGTSASRVKSVLVDTAHDRGPAGQDDDWGSGLVDGYAAVAGATSSSGATDFPAHSVLSDRVADDGTWRYEFDVHDASVPIAATLLVDGTWTCAMRVGGACWMYSWDGPDLDVQLIDPHGDVLDASTCPLGCHSGSIGRQETIDAMPSVPGTYALVVEPYDGDPNYGAGGPFTVDLSHGPVGTDPGTDPANSAPTADAVAAGTDEDAAGTVTLSGSDAETCELEFSIVSGPEHGSLGSVGAADCSGTGPHGDRATVTYTPDVNFHGVDSFTYAVTDGDGGKSPPATGTVEVSSVNDGPPTAEFTWSCTGLECAFTDASSDPSDTPHGSIASWSWSFDDGSGSSAQHPAHAYAVAGTYTVTLTATDADGATDTTSQSVTVAELTANPFTLAATGEKSKGTKYANLSWGGTTAPSVDVYRDGVRIATTANDGAYRDNAGKGGGTHTYRVCEEGSSTCSNEVSLSF